MTTKLEVTIGNYKLGFIAASLLRLAACILVGYIILKLVFGICSAISGNQLVTIGVSGKITAVYQQAYSGREMWYTSVSVFNGPTVSESGVLGKVGDPISITLRVHQRNLLLYKPAIKRFEGYSN